jgi:hypothetical protein
MPPRRLRSLLALAALAAGAARADEDRPIQDNSFLVEEAYNQEPGVIQHISLFTRERGTGNWQYTFTEEWPAPSRTHQVSVSLGVARTDESGAARTGFGDVIVNYRWQAVGTGEAAVAVAPRASLIVPSGDGRGALGHGGWGGETGVPVSVALGSRFVAHSNVDGTWVPAARASGGTGALLGLRLGQGLVWLAHRNVNLLVEATYELQALDAGDRTIRHEELLVSPGVRAALNVRGGLQIVGGVAVPIGVGPSAGDRAILGYLSFEHPITRAAREAAQASE